nr:T9SS type A sorting domain-containing protein [uncultured Flavobacterium sp.]
MKTKLFTVVALAATTFALAQTKSTGVVTTEGMTIKIDLDASTSTVTYTLTGPSNRWFALGLNATSMSTNNPIDVVQYGTSLLDRALTGGHNAPSTDPTNNLTLVTNTVSGTTRTIVATRPFSTGDTRDYTFNFETITSLNILWAVGPSTTVSAQHASRGTTTVTFSTVAGVASPTLESLVVYPVPAANQITIGNKAGLLIDAVNIFDINARLVKTLTPATSAEATTIDISSLETGTYFMEISGNGNKTVKKFSVKH